MLNYRRLFSLEATGQKDNDNEKEYTEPPH